MAALARVLLAGEEDPCKACRDSSPKWWLQRLKKKVQCWQWLCRHDSLPNLSIWLLRIDTACLIQPHLRTVNSWHSASDQGIGFRSFQTEKLLRSLQLPQWNDAMENGQFPLAELFILCSITFYWGQRDFNTLIHCWWLIIALVEAHCQNKRATVQRALH